MKQLPNNMKQFVLNLSYNKLGSRMDNIRYLVEGMK